MSEQNGFKGLEVVELNISKGEYLSEALKRHVSVTFCGE